VFGTPEKGDKCFNDIRITRSAWDSNFCAVNPKFVAICIEGGGGGPFLVLKHEEVGRISKSKAILDGHAAPVLDLAWSPFNDNIIATCSEDCTIKIWVIPDEGVQETSREAQLTLTGHQKRVLIVSWHPVAENVLLSSGADNMMVLWDVGNGCALTEIACHPDCPLSVSWNYDGSLFATTCKDRSLRVIDPRKGKVKQTRKNAHDGTKTSKALFLKDGRIITFGFSRMSDRQYALWDSRDLSAGPLVMEDIDRASGVLFPFYDPDTELIYAAGKGDGSIRYFEITDDAPYIHYISTYSSQQSQRGLGWMPKRGCDTTKCEIVRFYKLHPNKIEPVSFTVPRKSELFQADIYPPTISIEPAISCEDWWSGTNATPKLMDLSVKHKIASGKGTTRAMGASGGGLGSRFGASVSGGGLNSNSRSTNNSPGPASRVQSMPPERQQERVSHHQEEEEEPEEEIISPQRATKQSSGIGIGSKIGRGDAELEKGVDISMKSIKSGSVASNPFLQNAKTNSSGMPMTGVSVSPTTTSPSIPQNHGSLRDIPQNVKRSSSAGPAAAPEMLLPEGLNIQEILDDIKKLKATVKKQGRRIAHLESICGIESTKSKRDGENV
jgi:hypothetical protein